MKRKIKVEIKPVNTNDVISASVDELRTAVGILELPPPPSVVSVPPFYYVKTLQSTLHDENFLYCIVKIPPEICS